MPTLTTVQTFDDSERVSAYLVQSPNLIQWLSFIFGKNSEYIWEATLSGVECALKLGTNYGLSVILDKHEHYIPFHSFKPWKRPEWMFVIVDAAYIRRIIRIRPMGILRAKLDVTFNRNTHGIPF